MIKRSQIKVHQARAAKMLAAAGIQLRPGEPIEIAEFGLNDFEHFGLALVVYVNNNRYCGKELVLYPQQICPEHLHPPVGADPGKMETFRCRWGECYLSVEGKPAPILRASIPDAHRKHLTVFHEIVLRPGEQHTIPPGTKHWFQGGPQGAVVTEFSSASRDEADIFTDPNVKRIPEVIED